MPRPAIENGEEYFFPIIYSGNGQGQRVGKFVPFTDSGTIGNSCIFNSPDSPVLSRTPSGTGTSKKTFTISAWVKRSRLINSASFHSQNIFGVNHGSNSRYNIFGLFNNGSGNPTQVRLFLGKYTTGASTTGYDWVTNRTLEDTSKWYHLMAVVDTTDDTAADRVKLYIDGERVTSFASSSNPDENDEFYFGSEHDYYISTYNGSNGHWDGYMAEINFVDGTALDPSTFGETDTSTGRWVPKTLSGITYGTNGFRLTFQNNSAVANLGYDYQTSGRTGTTNDFTVTNLATTNQTTDSPTNNLPTIRPYNPSYSQTLVDGNRQHSTPGTNKGYAVCSTLRPTGSGKFYAECRISTTPGGNTIAVGCYAQEDLHNYSSGNAYFGNANLGSGLWIAGTNYLKHNGTTQSNPSFTFSAGDIIGLALDLDNGALSFYDDDNGLIGTIPFDKTKSACFGAMSNKTVTFVWNFGDNPLFSGAETSAGGNADGDGNGNFMKSVPTGFKVLKQDNMATTEKGVSGLVWTKNRDAADNHQWYDSSRGKQLVLASSATTAESTVADGLQKFLAGGQQIEDNVAINTSGESFVSWNWVANGGTTGTDHTQGSIDSTVQVNTTAGFSIVQWTGDNAAEATVGHGLSSTPEFIIIKNLDDTTDWFSYHKGLTADKTIKLNSNVAQNDFAFGEYDHSGINETVMTLKQGSTNANAINGASDSMIAYCWHSVDGFSKFGSYTGNGDTDGPFIYTGFRPAWVMIKRTNTTGNWYNLDIKRDPINPMFRRLYANLTNTQGTSGTDMDFLSNGFKLIRTGNDMNTSGSTYIYIAFAEHPFIGSKTLKGFSPVTAR